MTDQADYTVVVTNTSSAHSPDLIGPVLTDIVLGNLLSGANPFIVSSNADGVLSVGEVWTIQLQRAVQAGDPDPLEHVVSGSFTVALVPAAGFDGGNVLAPGTGSDLAHTVNLFTAGIVAVKAPDKGLATGRRDHLHLHGTNYGSSDSPALENVVLTDDTAPRPSPATAATATASWTRARPGRTRSAARSGRRPDPLINNAEVNANVTDAPEEGFDGRNPCKRGLRHGQPVPAELQGRQERGHAGQGDRPADYWWSSPTPARPTPRT